MSCTIIRNGNYKTSQLAGIYKHNERKNTNYSNKEIKKEKSINNYSIKEPYSTYEKMFKDIKEKYNLKGQIKRVSNIVCEYIITSDNNFFKNVGDQETRRYFETAYKFVCQYKGLNEKYILSAKVHMDETTPHMHLVYIPVIHTKDKKGNDIDKIACSEFWKGKDSYKKLQDNFYKYIKENNFELDRGKERNIEHLSTEKLKQITNYENIKYELTQEEIKPINTQNTALIAAQNQQLIEYTNKLKLYLSKSYSAINRMEKLQKENTDLKYENQKLKEQNYKLIKYIQKTFNVVKTFFNIPIDKFKNIVDNFLKSK